MLKKSQIITKAKQKHSFITEIREKMGISQESFAMLLGVSRPLLALAERKKRELPQPAWDLVTKMHLQFEELESGVRSNNHSLATRLIMDSMYRAEIPMLKAREKACRLQVTSLLQELGQLKERERNAKNAMIIHASFLKQLEEKVEKDAAARKQLAAFALTRESVKQQLTEVWAPAQVGLQLKIETLKAEARVLCRTRLLIMREQQPLKH